MNIDDKEIYKDATKIDVGFVTRKELKCLSKNNFMKEKRIMEFY